MNAFYPLLLRGFTLFMLIALPAVPALAQQQTPLDLSLRHLEQQREAWQLADADLADLVVSDQFVSQHNGVSHFYFIQRFASIPIHNAVSGVHVTAAGKVAFATNRFIPRIGEKVNTTEPGLTAYEAVVRAAGHVGAPVRQPLRLLDNPDNRHFRFAGDGVAKSDIPVKLVFQYLRQRDELRLAWDVSLDQIDASDYWSIRVDALTGEILERDNWTLYCSFRPEEKHSHSAGCGLDDLGAAEHFRPVQEALAQTNLLLNDNASYRVWPVPVESPIHGDRELLVDPHDPLASPFGWHDVNGNEGPEFRITRGNNVHAYQDSDNQNASSNDEPDGGDDLIFDLPFDPAIEPDSNTNQEAAVIQLFYMNNIMHDFSYAYGFDPAAGNFQQNTYGPQGVGQDFVLAEAQDGSGTNNANFSSPPDGINGRMQMFLWDRSGGELLTILEPDVIAGSYTTSAASFGTPIPQDPLQGLIVAALDGTSSPGLACNTIVNADEVAGNIALIDRGTCFFEEKTANAEAAGAIAVIICNYENNVIGMAGVPEVSDPGIPTIMLRSTDCNLIKNLLSEGVTASLQQPQGDGPQQVDGTLDNGIVAHEYGHGISIRLTGGASASGCLSNDEQMGEGWSDFFTLVTSVKPDDTGELPRGIGNYAIRAGVNGGGIRRLPYSTDLLVNNQEYDDVIATTAPHPLGEVWASVLWDLYWRLVDVYGYDEDLYYGSGGNNIAIQLVMDGMKLQACNPGFIDGRDAIIAADFINNDGANECLIWEVFARRGFGIDADQNSPFNRNDGRPDFNPLPECIKELKITKSVTPLIEAGEEIQVSLKITNHKNESASGVIVTDRIPAGATLTDAPASATINGDIISFDIGNLASGASQSISYTLASSPDLASVRQFFDDMEDGDGNWLFLPLTGFDVWELGFTTQAYSGFNVWSVPNTPNENDQVLQIFEPITVSGSQPVLRFYHRYQTDEVVDGGIVQISTDGGNSWEEVTEDMFKNEYRGKLDFQVFATPNLRGFWGSTQGFIDTYIDLSQYIGQEILFRFRFGTGADENSNFGGWFIDNVEIFDLFNYDTEACVSSEQGDLACAQAPHRGTIVEPGLSTATGEAGLEESRVRVFPNPAGDLLNISLELSQSGPVEVEILSTDGRLLLRERQGAGAGQQILPLNVSALNAGLYLVRVRTPEGLAVEKVTIR